MMAHILSALVNRITKSRSSKYLDITDRAVAVSRSPGSQFEAIVKLALVETQAFKDEDVLLSLRATLFHYDVEADSAEWKERGRGQCQILKHKTSGLVRIIMRRENTLNICANHYIYPHMELKPNCGSERAWVWSTVADYAEAKRREFIFAIRFANTSDGQMFKSVFDLSAEEMKKILQARKLAACEDQEKDERDSSSDDSEDKGKEVMMPGYIIELPDKLKDLEETTA